MLRRSLLAAPLLALPKVGYSRSMFSGHGTYQGILPTSYAFSNYYSYNSAYPTKYNQGDGYAPTWADDGFLYTQTNDAIGGFQNEGGVGNTGLAKLDGYTSALTGHNVGDWSIFGASNASGGPNQWIWKCGGVLSVGSNLYLAMTGFSNLGTGSPVTQTQLVLSTDHGATFSPAPPPGILPYPSGMLDNVQFRGFVQYGQAYTGTGPDNSSLYVYAYHSSGANAYLARCLTANLTQSITNGTDWTWYTGGDGMNSANWAAGVGSAAIVWTMVPALGGGSGFYIWVNVQYLPHFQCYVMCPTYWPGGNSSGSRVQVQAALHPWGPFTQIGAEYDATSLDALYDLSIVPSSVAVNSGVTTVLMGSGDFNSATLPGKYCLHLLTMTLS
jgi:hypothetical protein